MTKATILKENPKQDDLRTALHQVRYSLHTSLHTPHFYPLLRILRWILTNRVTVSGDGILLQTFRFHKNLNNLANFIIITQNGRWVRELLRAKQRAIIYCSGCIRWMTKEIRSFPVETSSRVNVGVTKEILLTKVKAFIFCLA